MIVIHKSYDASCLSLGKTFEDSSDIQNLAKKFVLINIQVWVLLKQDAYVPVFETYAVQDQEEQNLDAKFAPDGGYVPRIFFSESNGKIMEDVFCPGGARVCFYPFLKVVGSSRIATAQVFLLQGKGSC